MKEIVKDNKITLCLGKFEVAKLIEAGFEYVCTTPEGVMLFRKRK